MRYWRLGVPLIPLLWAGSVLDAQEKGAPAEKRTLTAESFLDLRTVRDPQFSPDGARVAFVVSEPLKDDKHSQHIWIYDRTAKSARQLTFSTKSETSPRWSPDGGTLAFLSDRGEEQQVFLLRMQGGEGVALTTGKGAVESFAWSPDGKSMAYLAPDPKTEAEEKREKEKDDARVVDKMDKHARLRLIDLATKETRTITEPNWKVEQMEWLPNGHELAVAGTDHPESDRHTSKIMRVSTAGGAMKELLAPRGPFGDLRVSPDGAMIAFIGSREDGPQPHDLQLLPVSGGAARNLTGASLDRQIVDYRWAKDGSLVAVYAEGFRNEFVRYKADGERSDLGPALSVNAGQFSLSASGDAAFVGETATSAQELWMRDTAGETEQASHIHEAWKGYTPIAPEFYKYKSFDGQEIEAALLRPAGSDGKGKLPTIALIHGGPTGNWEDRIDAWGQLLVARGFVVFYPNVRGSIGYGQKFIEMNRGDWGGGDFKDVMAGVEDLISKGVADPERLGIGGWSYGGYMAEWAVTQTARFKGAVSGAGMANLISEFGTEAGPAYDEWFYGVPYERPEGFLNSSPFVYVKNAKTPTLILQGEADAIDPIGQSQELYRGLKRYGVETELVLYPREPHGFQEAKHRADVLNRMAGWFEKYVKGEAKK